MGARPLKILVKVVKRSTGRVHQVHAVGFAHDGSLYGFATYCGLRITVLEDWDEPAAARKPVTCQKCIAARPKARRELAAARRWVRESLTHESAPGLQRSSQR